MADPHSENTCPTCNAPAPTTTLCWACTRQLQHLLADLDEDLTELHTQLAHQSRLGAGTGSRSAERPLPYDIRAADVLDNVRSVLVGWTRIACETSTTPRPDNTEPAMIAHLRRHHWAIHPAADELLDELQYTHDEVLACIDSPTPRRYLGPCGETLDDGYQECEGDVYQRGTATPTCRSCGATHDTDQRLRWIADQAADQLVTAAEAIGALSAWGDHISRDLLDSWAKRGRLTGKGHNLRGHKLYRFGDIRLLAVQTITRKRHAIPTT